MKSKREAHKYLASLGAVRWDTNPPSKGRIIWYDTSDNEIATASYKVILSVGPGNMYTMAYGITGYKLLKIPFVEKADDGPVVVESVTDENVIISRAEAIGKKINADMIYQCLTLLVAIFDFKQK